ncbi:MAG TPA: LD-carboxypeptidase [Bacillota bacterium]|nr:LD-carboxypeptidase [Bacillota bacterium]
MKPFKLRKNDKLGIVSPSSPVTDDVMAQFRQGVDYLKALGFELVIAKNALSNSLGYSASPEEKAEDINAMFCDPGVKAIICSQGGATANACLPFLDWEMISRNPKIFLGISDITVLLNAIHAKTGLITFHGNDVAWGFGREPKAYDRQEFMDRLINGKVGLINSNGARTTVRGGIAEGRLLGGNLGCLLKLAGTPYFPNFEEAILFLESYGFSPEACHSNFAQLEQSGVFDKIKGIIVGYIYGEGAFQRGLHLEDVLTTATAKYQLPILKVNDFGHNCPNTVIPVGAKAKLNADEKTIEIIEACVIEEI